MVRKFASIAVAGALMMVAAPVFAQDINLNPLGLPLVPNSLGAIDLDPLHIFTPAPAAAPAGPAVVVVHHHHHHHHHHAAHKAHKAHAKKK